MRRATAATASIAVKGDNVTRGLLLEITAPSGKGYQEIVENIANKKPMDLSDFDVVLHPSPLESFKADFVDYIVKYGLSSLLRRALLTEAIVGPTAARSFVEDLAIRFLRGIEIEDEMIVVDPYFFATTTDPTYPQLVENVFRPFLGTLKSLTVVTLPSFNNQVRTDVTMRLNGMAANLNIAHRTTSKFHDRFWLNPRKRKGFLSGASLNGLGRKYAVVDYLLSEDVDDVLSALASENLISSGIQRRSCLSRIREWLR